MLGSEVDFKLDSASVYTYQCRRLVDLRLDRVLFAGDAAHQTPPFGARGVNSGIQDVDNLVWKLKLVLNGIAQENLMDTYNEERGQAAKESFESSVRSADFIIPKSKASETYREAVLGLARQCAFAQPMVNSGRQSVPCIYGESSLNGPDDDRLPAALRPGAPALDVPLAEKWLIDLLGNKFILLTLNIAFPHPMAKSEIAIKSIHIRTGPSSEISKQYLGDSKQAVYLIRPDHHIAARWRDYDVSTIQEALNFSSKHIMEE